MDIILLTSGVFPFRLGWMLRAGNGCGGVLTSVLFLSGYSSRSLRDAASKVIFSPHFPLVERLREACVAASERSKGRGGDGGESRS